MRRPSVLIGALIGGLASLPLIALSYLGSQAAGLPFYPFDLFEWLTRILPGRLVITGIDTMVRFILLLGLGSLSSTAKLLEQVMGLLLIVASLMIAGLVVAWLMQRTPWSGPRAGMIVGTLVLLGFVAIELSLASLGAQPLQALAWLAVLSLAWGAATGAVLASVPAAEAAMSGSGATTRPVASAAASPAAAEVLPPVEAAVAAPPDAQPAPSVPPQDRASAPRRLDRRAFLLRAAGGAAGLTVVALGAGRLLGERGAGQAVSAATLPPAAVPAGTVPPAAPTAAASAALPAATPAASAQAELTPVAGATRAAILRDLIPPAPGTRPELTDNANFYRIDIDLLPPEINESSWFVDVRGLFTNPHRMTLADIKSLPAVTQAVTMSCISNPVGGDLIGTSNWTGARLRDVLKQLGLKPEAKGLFLQAADGFYETVVLDDMMDPRTLLVYEMNGEPLPQAHGFPLRIYIPNRYGMKQPKWITSMEAVSQERVGYWVERGWSLDAHPQIVSVIDAVATKDAAGGKVPVGGIAWAGDRGIKKVEVQVDDGDWNEAALRTPALSSLTWIQWRYDWPAVPGRHTFRVRATDGTGALQISQPADTFPDGATGYHSATVNI